MTTSIEIVSKDTNGNEVRRNLTYVNPQASNTDLKTFARSLVNLSNNNYFRTVRIDKTDLDND